MQMHLLHKLPTPSQATAASFSSDGSLLGVGCDDGSFRIYDAHGGRVRKAVRGLPTGVSGVVFHSVPSATSTTTTTTTTTTVTQTPLPPLSARQTTSPNPTAFKQNVNVWIASGRSLYHFELSEADSDSDARLVLSPADAVMKVDVDIGIGIGTSLLQKAKATSEEEAAEEDSINCITLSANEALLAFTTDDGGVYSLDLATREISRMRASHSSIAWGAAFVPDRPNELVSGGYDCTLLHSDVRLRTRLSQLEISASPGLAPGFGSIPPFVTALAVSPLGVLVAGLADGRVFVGLGGAQAQASFPVPTSTPTPLKGPNTMTTRQRQPSEKKKEKKKEKKETKKKKRPRKWDGLVEEEGFYAKVADAMIVGLAFVDAGLEEEGEGEEDGAPMSTFVSCTVNGQLMVHSVVHSSAEAEAEVSQQQQQQQQGDPARVRSSVGQADTDANTNVGADNANANTIGVGVGVGGTSPQTRRSRWSLKTKVLAQSSCQKVDALALSSSLSASSFFHRPNPNPNPNPSPSSASAAGFVVAVCGLHEDGRRGCVELWASGSGSDSDSDFEDRSKSASGAGQPLTNDSSGGTGP